MPYTYTRIVRFADTDAAGVVFFANVLNMCHEVYEASLADAGIDIKSFFTHPTTAFPIVQVSSNFRRPMYCGDRLLIHLSLGQYDDQTFELGYQIQLGDRVASTTVIKHVCIDPDTRDRQPLPAEILQWLQSLN